MVIICISSVTTKACGNTFSMYCMYQANYQYLKWPHLIGVAEAFYMEYATVTLIGKTKRQRFFSNE